MFIGDNREKGIHTDFQHTLLHNRPASSWQYYAHSLLLTGQNYPDCSLTEPRHHLPYTALLDLSKIRIYVHRKKEHISILIYPLTPELSIKIYPPTSYKNHLLPRKKIITKSSKLTAKNALFQQINYLSKRE